MKDYSPEQQDVINKAIAQLIKQLGRNVSDNISRLHHFSVCVRFDTWEELELFATPEKRRKTKVLDKEIAALYHPEGLLDIYDTFNPSKQVRLEVLQAEVAVSKQIGFLFPA